MIAQEGTAVILVEQHAETVLTLTQDAVVMERGAIVHRAPSRELLNDAATLDRLIGLKIEAYILILRSPAQPGVSKDGGTLGVCGHPSRAASRPPQDEVWRD